MAPDYPPHDPAPPRRLAHRIAVTAATVCFVLVIGFVLVAPHIELNEYAIAPGTAQAVAPLVTVPAGRDHRLHGTLLLTDVDLSQVNAFSWLFDRWSSDTQMVPADEVLDPGVPPAELTAQGYLEMQQSQTAAKAEALSRLGFAVRQRPAGTLVDATVQGDPAARVLAVGQTVTAIDGTPTPDVCAFVGALHDKLPGQTATLRIEQSSVNANAELVNGPTVTRTVRLAKAPARSPGTGCPGLVGPSKVRLGVSIEDRLDFRFPFPLSIDTQDIGGPSAGLAMTLALIDKLSDGSLTVGKTVAVTGTIDQYGDVREVGGVPQKTIAVERAGATVFLVPPGNYHDALSKATPSLHVYPVSTLNQALAVLRRLGGHIPPLPAADAKAGAGIAGGCAGQ